MEPTIQEIKDSMRKNVATESAKINTSTRTTKTPFQRAQEELFEKRKKIADKKAAELGKHYTDRFNQYLGEYFDNFAQSKEENQVAYDILNKSWKKYANEANASQKYVVLKVNSFEEEVARIVKKNAQFQEFHPVEIPEEVVDLTNLKSK